MLQMYIPTTTSHISYAIPVTVAHKACKGSLVFGGRCGAFDYTY